MPGSRPQHATGCTSDLPAPVTDDAERQPAEVSGSGPPAGIDVDALLASRAVTKGEIVAAVTITVQGDIDEPALERIREVLTDLVATRTPVVADLYRARCRTGQLLAELTEFRARRRQLELETQLRGLHPEVIPDLESVDLTEVFSAYRESQRSPYSGTGRGPARRA